MKIILVNSNKEIYSCRIGILAHMEQIKTVYDGNQFYKMCSTLSADIDDETDNNLATFSSFKKRNKEVI